MYRVDLTNSSLYMSDLSGARLIRVDLTGTDLRLSYMKDIQLENSNINKAKDGYCMADSVFIDLTCKIQRTLLSIFHNMKLD